MPSTIDRLRFRCRGMIIESGHHLAEFSSTYTATYRHEWSNSAFVPTKPNSPCANHLMYKVSVNPSALLGLHNELRQFRLVIRDRALPFRGELIGPKFDALEPTVVIVRH